MKTAVEMNDYALSHNLLYTGKSGIVHFEVIERNLDKNEEILMALTSNGVFNKDDIIFGNITAVALTDKRIVLSKNDLGKGVIKSIDYSNIKRIYLDKYGIIMDKVVIEYNDDGDREVKIQVLKERNDDFYKSFSTIITSRK